MIQIDLPMPEACDVCPMNYDFGYCLCFENRDDWEKYSKDWNSKVCERKDRPEYCPLKEQKTGHWIEYEGTQGNYYDCSVCDCSLMEIHRGMKYCPYCGAKMDNPM